MPNCADTFATHVDGRGKGGCADKLRNRRVLLAPKPKETDHTKRIMILIAREGYN